ncbi:DNA repair protein SWI5 homolog [Melopsittacus undulatus]|uniref:DNA repair protein SWI5 homolog n=1 Tax=Melopsittacus undulatus TaxID=13146 RepID=UPI001469B731|nr:DNA repair protein SWI5 homolog [Melopsittacus undulatus]
MSAPRPGHVSRGGERRRRPPGSAPARPELRPERPHRSSAMGAGARSSPGCVRHRVRYPRCAVPGPAAGDAPRPCGDSVALGKRRERWDYNSRRAPRQREDYNSQHAPRRQREDYRSQHAPRRQRNYESQNALRYPVRRQAAAVAELVSPRAGRSPAPPPRAPLRRASGGGGRSGAAGFKSPIPSPRPCQPNRDNNESLQYEIEELKQKDLALDQEIAQLLSEGYSLEELEKHISLLHEYNDIKDAGQMLLGKLAVIRGVTTKQLYPEYDLELSD